MTQVGCAQKNSDKRSYTFVRVIHTPTGKERMIVGIGDENALAVTERLIREIDQELEQDG
jgi:hypothetical protein